MEDNLRHEGENGRQVQFGASRGHGMEIKYEAFSTPALPYKAKRQELITSEVAWGQISPIYLHAGQKCQILYDVG